MPKAADFLDEYSVSPSAKSFLDDVEGQSWLSRVGRALGSSISDSLTAVGQGELDAEKAQAKFNAEVPPAAFDTAMRVEHGLVQGTGQAITGAGRIREMAGNFLDEHNPATVFLNPDQRAYMRQQNAVPDIIALGQSVSKLAEPFRGDPARDRSLLAQGAEFAGSALPLLASGPAAVVTGPAMLGEQIRERALQPKQDAQGNVIPGDTPEVADAKFVLGAVVGGAASLVPGADKLGSRWLTPELAMSAPLVTKAAIVGGHAATAGAAGATLDATIQQLTEGKIDWKQTAQTGMLTGVLGALGGGLRAQEVERLAGNDRATMARAWDLGFKGNTMDELAAWKADVKNQAIDWADTFILARKLGYTGPANGAQGLQEMLRWHKQREAALAELQRQRQGNPPAADPGNTAPPEQLAPPNPLPTAPATPTEPPVPAGPAPVPAAVPEQLSNEQSAAANSAIQRRDYTPAIVTKTGAIVSGASHEVLAHNARIDGDQALTRGYVDKDGNFLSFMDVARAVMAKKVPGVVGKTWEARLPDDPKDRVGGNWRVVEASQLQTLSGAEGNGLQNRDRTRAASDQQIASIASKLDPELLGDSLTTDLGAPIVNDQMQVISGNGRTAAIRQRYGAADRGRDYAVSLQQNAPRYGIDPADIASMREPVLVRHVTNYGGFTPQEVARRSNAQQVLGLSESERAGNDAALIVNTPELLSKFRPSEDGDVLAATNRDFLNHFIDASGSRAELTNKEGTGYAPALGPRVRNAVLAAVVGHENRQVIDALTENSEGMRKITGGLLNTAPAMLRLRGTPYDLGGVLRKTLTDMVSLRQTGMSLDDHLAQGSLFNDPLRTAESDLLHKTLAGLKSARGVTDFLNRYAELAGKIDRTTPDMFGAANATQLELLRRAAGDSSPGPGAAQTVLAPSPDQSGGKSGELSPQPERPVAPAPASGQAGAGQGLAPPEAVDRNRGELDELEKVVVAKTRADLKRVKDLLATGKNEKGKPLSLPARQNMRKHIAGLEAKLTHAGHPIEPPLAPAPNPNPATTGPTAAPVVPREEIGIRPGASNLLSRASAVFQRLLSISPNGNSIWHQQMREQIGNPERYHRVVEDENPKGLAIGDKVTVAPGTHPTQQGTTQGIVLGVEKTKATAYGGGYSVKVAQMEEGKFPGYVGIDRVSKLPPPKAAPEEPPPAEPMPESPPPKPPPQPGPTEGGAKRPFEDKMTDEEKAEWDELEKQMRRKFGQVNAGIDPEYFAIGAKMARMLVKLGARTFRDFAKAMLEKFGEKARPYLLAWYENLRNSHDLDPSLLESNVAAQKIYDSEFSNTRDVSGRDVPPVSGEAGARRSPSAKVVRKELIPEPKPFVGADTYSSNAGFRLDADQTLGANLILSHFAKSSRAAFVLGDGTGFGKTAQILAVIDQYRRKIKPGASVLYVTQNRQMLEGTWARDSAAMGIDLAGVDAKTYTSIKEHAKGKYDLVVFDEAHNLKNAEAQKSMAAARIEAAHTLFATATPMDKATGAAYFLAAITGKSEHEIAEKLGYELKSREDPVTKQIRECPVLLPGHNWAKVWKHIMEYRDAAIAGGAMLRREYPFYGTVKEVPISWTPADQKVADDIEAHYDALPGRLTKGRKTLALRRWSEQSKLETAFSKAMEHLKTGGQVIIMAETDKKQSFPVPIPGAEEGENAQGKPVWRVDGAISKLTKMFEKAGVKIAHIHDTKANRVSVEVNKFQGGLAPVALATPKSGGTGINLDDTVGKKNRLMLALSPELAGDVFDQVLGRVSRKTTQSESTVELFHNPESYADQRSKEIRDKKIKTLRAIQGGEDPDFGGAAPASPVRWGAPGEQEPTPETETTEDMAAAPSGPPAPPPPPTTTTTSPLSPGYGPLPSNNPIIQQFQQIQAAIAPTTLGAPGEHAAGLLRKLLAEKASEMARAEYRLNQARHAFDWHPVLASWKYDPTQPLPPNYAFINAYETGNVASLPPQLRSLAAKLHQLNAADLDRVHDLGVGALKTFYEDYFPHIWKDPVGAQRVISSILAKRPLEGPKSFLKQRTYQLFVEGLEHGLVPVHDNPIDLWLLKKNEVERFILGTKFQQQGKAAGLIKFNYYASKRPVGWSAPKDPAFGAWAPPFVTIKEAFDAGMREKTLEALQKLGVPHDRLVAIGGKRWGYAEYQKGRPGSEHIVSKFGGPEFVIWHELGHALDNRYPDMRRTLFGAPADEVVSVRGRSNLGHKLSPRDQEIVQRDNELRALADARGPGLPLSYLRKTEEKMAVVLQAYLHAPDLMAKLAPTIKTALSEFIQSHPELNVIEDIRPTLRLGVGEAEMPVGGMVKLGDWIMPDAATRVVDNFLGPGLNRFLLYRGARAISHTLTAAQLSISGFHAGFTTIDVIASHLSLAIKDAAEGRAGPALAGFAHVPVSWMTNPFRGSTLRKAVLNPGTGSAEIQAMVKALEAGGGRISQDAFWQTQFTRRIIRSLAMARQQLRTGEYFGGGMNLLSAQLQLPFALIEQVARPVLEYLVPRQKLGVFMSMAAQEMRAMGPGVTQDVFRKRMQLVWQSVENRMGEIAYDNYFYNRAMKDVAMLTFRAFGWQQGKVLEGGGAVIDTGKAINDIRQGKGPMVTHKMAYVVALVMTLGFLGGLIHYLFTGRRPKGRDWFQPQTGETDRYGNPVRLNLPTYGKDVMAYSHHPLTALAHSLGPVFSAVFDLLANKDFYDTQIRNPDDPLWKQASDVMKWAMAEMVPFSFSGAARLHSEDAPAWKLVAPFFGFTPVPLRDTMSPAQNLSAEIMSGSMPKEAMTQKQAGRAELLRDIVKKFQSGDKSGAGKDLADGVLNQTLSPTAISIFMDKLQMSPLQFQVNHFSPEQAMRVWQLANPQEKTQLWTMIKLKVLNAESLTDSERKEMFNRLGDQPTPQLSTVPMGAGAR